MKFARLRPTKLAHFNSLWEFQKTADMFRQVTADTSVQYVCTFVLFVPSQKFNISTKHGKRRHSDSSHQKEEMKLVCLE